MTAHQTILAVLEAPLRPATTDRLIRMCRMFCLLLSMAPLGCGDEVPPKDSPCGSGSVQLEIGVDDPWRASELLHFSVDEGLQGGYHVDVSIKALGYLDPDSVNILLELDVDGRRIARHVTDDWLLKIYPDEGHCEYPRARLVFTDSDGSLMPLDDVEELIGSQGRLKISLESPDGAGQETFDIHLETLNRR